MTGINRYYDAIKSVDSTVLNESTIKDIVLNKSKISIGQKPCIFLSHKSEDKEAVIQIGEYILSEFDVDIYLDIEDKALQAAVVSNDHHAITQSIEIALLYSSHIMVIVSEETKNSWWVPYEIGFAKSNEIKIATLELFDVNYLPSFLNITKKLKCIRDLEMYISKLQKKSGPFEMLYEVLARDTIMKKDYSNSVLRQYLKT